MASLLTFSALVLLIQSTSSQCLPLGACGNGFLPTASGGNFFVTSSSPVAPIGVSIVSNNLYEGGLIVDGNLPLLGSVALEGTMRTAGAGAVSYGCGDESTLGQCLSLGTCGNDFFVTSSSSVAPIGISLVSNNLYEGNLIVDGNLPLLGSVALEGTMGTTGAGTVSYGCGDQVGILAEVSPIVTGIVVDAASLGYGLYNFGNFYGLGNLVYGLTGCGYGVY